MEEKSSVPRINSQKTKSHKLSNAKTIPRKMEYQGSSILGANIWEVESHEPSTSEAS